MSSSTRKRVKISVSPAKSAQKTIEESKSATFHPNKDFIDKVSGLDQRQMVTNSSNSFSKEGIAAKNVNRYTLGCNPD